VSINQSKNSHKATHGQGEADPSATSRTANPASQATQASKLVSTSFLVTQGLLLFLWLGQCWDRLLLAHVRALCVICEDEDL